MGEQKVALQSFRPEPPLAKALVGGSTVMQFTASDGSEMMWKMLDYGWLSDSARTLVLEEAMQEQPPRTPLHYQHPWIAEDTQFLSKKSQTAGLLLDTGHLPFKGVEYLNSDSLAGTCGEMSIELAAYSEGWNDHWADIFDHADWPST